MPGAGNEITQDATTHREPTGESGCNRLMERRRLREEVLGKSRFSVAEETEGGCGYVCDGTMKIRAWCIGQVARPQI